jgi:integrase
MIGAAPTPPSVDREKLKFKLCKDARGREIRGLWQRNGRFYAQVRPPGKNACRRVPLMNEHNHPVSTVAQAVTARAALLAGFQKGIVPGPRITPLFLDYVIHYTSYIDETEAKSVLTVIKEKSSLKGWAEFLGATRLSQITRKQINDYALERKKEGLSNRTINLDIIALKNLLKFAKEEGWLRHDLPTKDWKQLSHTATRRQLIPEDAVERLCAAALATKTDQEGRAVPKYANGQMLADFIKLLAYSGARRMAGLRAKWSQVDFSNRQITFYTKYDKRVVVDFNPKLETHLKDMDARRGDRKIDPLFPSTRPGEAEANIVTGFEKTFLQVRQDAKLPDTKFHDLRHAFISWAVMSGIDTLTVAQWVGHADGGMLIGKIYGHLNPQHRRDSAAKLQFTNGKREEAPKQEPRQEPKQEPSPTLDLSKLGLDLTKVSLADLLKLAKAKSSD